MDGVDTRRRLLSSPPSTATPAQTDPATTKWGYYTALHPSSPCPCTGISNPDQCLTTLCRQKSFVKEILECLWKWIAFCWYYLRTKINVLRKVCIRVKGINWKVKEGEGGEGACHISSKKPHCRKISQERSLPMHSPASDRKSKIQSCATL